MVFVFPCQPKKWIDNILKQLVTSSGISERERRSLQLVGTKPGIMYGLC